MKYKFFYIPLGCSESSESDLNVFLASNKIHAIDKQFTATGEQVGWGFCISFDPSSSIAQNLRNKNNVDYRETLNAEDFDVFAELRRLRKKIAEEQAVPAYVVFSNEQLASMVTKRIRTLMDLKSIDGVGQARCDRYGEIFLKCLNDRQQMTKTEENR